MVELLDNERSDGRLRIAMVSGVLHPSYGGPPQAVRSHVAALEGAATVDLFGVAARHHLEELQSELPRARLFREAWPRRWFRGVGLTRALIEAARRVDVIHAHMLWDHAVLASWLASRITHRPLVISPHGSLAAPWRYRSLEKQLYRWAVADRILGDAACVHALSTGEKRACVAAGVRAPIAVVPNGLPSRAFKATWDPEIALNRWPLLRRRPTVLYLGRLSREKGLEMLIDAWAQAVRDSRHHEWVLVLAGPDHRGHERHLRDRVQRCGIENDVVFVGQVAGELKWSLLAASQCLVLTSRSEAFSISLLEAMAAGLPALYTDTCNLPELAATGGGWEIRATSAETKSSLQALFAVEPSTLRSMGEKARALGERRFTLETVGRGLLQIYRSVLH